MSGIILEHFRDEMPLPEVDNKSDSADACSDQATPTQAAT